MEKGARSGEEDEHRRAEVGHPAGEEDAVCGSPAGARCVDRGPAPSSRVQRPRLSRKCTLSDDRDIERWAGRADAWEKRILFPLDRCPPVPSALRLAAAFLLALSAACSGADATSAPSASLTVKGSGSPPPAGLLAPAALRGGSARSTILSGTPASLTLTVYALYISPNDDCSSMQLVQDYGAAGSPKDFMQNPVLFSGSPAAGAYKCVAIKMSDVIHMTPASTFGACVAGTDYPGDIYRAGQTDWKDVNLNQIIGTGTDSVPSNDHVTIFMPRNALAAIARGLSVHQVIPLSSDLVVPAQTTFYWDATGTVQTDGVQCGVNPGQPSFH